MWTVLKQLEIYTFSKNQNAYCSQINQQNNPTTITVNGLDIINAFLCVGYPTKYYGFWHDIRKNRFFKVFFF
jgi:hypothetical protein